MYSFVINKDTPEEIYTAICDYCNYHGTNNAKKHLGLKTKYIYIIFTSKWMLPGSIGINIGI